MVMKFSITSIVLATICIVISIKINYDMSVEYHTVSGKTQALFGLTHLNRLYYSLIGMTALIISFFGMWKRESKKMLFIAFILSLLSIIITFVELWRYLI